MVNWLSPEILAQEVHAVIGAAIVFGSWLLLRELPGPKYPWAWISLAVFGAIVVVKEVAWDPLYEINQPFLWAGSVDLGFYALGIMVALGLVYARFRTL